MTKTLAVTRSEPFLRGVNLIDDLERYALQQGDPVDPDRVPLLSDEQKKRLSSPDSRLLIQDWLAAYRQSIDLLRSFRNAVVHKPEEITDVDIREVTDGVERVMRGLRRRLD